MDIIPITVNLRVKGVHDGQDIVNGMAIAFRQGATGLEYLVAESRFESAPLWVHEASITGSYVLKNKSD
jgi:hypothetical protein